ncbi:MAG: PKD domain-containing protein, partial [Thermoplasmata archaeon]
NIVAENDGPSDGLMSLTWVKTLPGSWYATLLDVTNADVTSSINDGTLSFNLNNGEEKSFLLIINSTTSAGFAQNGTVNIIMSSSGGLLDSVSAFAEICEPDQLILTNAPDGTPLSLVNMLIGQQIKAYASAYNTTIPMYLGLVPVDWVDSPDLGAFDNASGTSSTFTAATIGTATIFGNSTGLGLKDDFTVQIASADSTAPASSVSPTDDYWLKTAPWNIDAFASDDISGVASVILWTRFSPDNTTWESWTAFGTDTDYPWGWAFIFPSGNGYYEFYSIAMDADSNVEQAPSSADAACAYDTVKPTIEDASGLTATTGEYFTVTASVHDDMALHGSHLVYWFGIGTEFNVTMTGTGNTKTIQVAIPLTSLDILHYQIAAVDRAKNWNITPVKNVTIIDNDPPTADAGPDRTVDAGDAVTFDGSGSSDNIEVYNCTWTFINGGATITLWGNETEYTFWDVGTYTVTLEARDAAGNSDTDECIVTAENANMPPTANAGSDITVDSGVPITFDGSGSTDAIGIANYTWTFTYNGTEMALWGVSPQFTFWKSGAYEVTLTVRDGGGLTDTDTVQIKVNGGILSSGYCWVIIIIGIVIALLVLLLLLRGRKKDAQGQEELIFVPANQGDGQAMKDNPSPEPVENQ